MEGGDGLLGLLCLNLGDKCLYEVFVFSFCGKREGKRDEFLWVLLKNIKNTQEHQEHKKMKVRELGLGHCVFVAI